MKRKLTLFVVILLTSCAFARAQTSSVTGIVKDDQGTLPGVTVTEKGTTNAVTTDVNGKYTIKVPATGTLVFSFIGYNSQEQPVNNRTVINLVLVNSNKQLSEVVVVGYGTQKKGDITSAISTVSVKDISTRPIVTPEEALIGKAPGVQVSIPSGEPGHDLSVRIRGIGSVNGVEPLYVVDGVLANDIKTLDPNSIESISILKDASATGIYGAAGSTNGVVMITTKQGTKGKSKIDASFYTGMQQISKKIAVLNNQQWLALQTEIDGGTPPVIPSFYNLNTTNNNWQDLIYHNAIQNNANIGVSGGSETGTYYLGLGYLNQDGIVRGSNFDRYSAKFSVNQMANSWLTIGGNINFNRSNQRTVPQNAPAARGGSILSVLQTPQYIPIIMPAGSPHPGVYGYSTFYSGDNPFSDIYNNTNNTIANNLLGDAHVEIKLPFDIKYRSQFNFTLENSNYQYFLDPFKSLNGLGTNGSASQNYNETTRWAWDNTLTYDKTFGLSKINVVVGTSALDEKIFFSSQSGTGFGSSAIQTLNGASSVSNPNTSGYEWSTNSYFGRATYSYNDRYLLTATLRSDGTSRVGINEQYGTFPAFSVGWKVSSEDFMKDVNWVQDLKIRAGWGKTGNLPPYSMLYPSYTLLGSGNYPFNSSTSGTPGYSPGGQIGNPDLKWESATSTNIGFDASFLNKRINLSADYYYKKVTDLIFIQSLPGSTGGKQIASNLPANDINKGFEFSIDAAIVKQHDFNWDMNLNMSFNTNKIQGLDPNLVYNTATISLGGGGGPSTQIIKNGYGLGTFWGYVAEGVDPATGNEKFSDNPTNLGSALPKFNYGIAENFRYKAFTLSLLFDGVYGNKIYDATRQETEQLNGPANETAGVLARWEKPGDITSVPTAINNGTTNSSSINFLNTNATSYYLESGSFFRLRNATLGYNFDPELLKHIGIGNLRLFITGQNLFTITKYKGYTPDVNSFGNGTNNKPANAGDGGPSPLALGVDDGAYPAARIYTIGVNVQF